MVSVAGVGPCEGPLQALTEVIDEVVGGPARRRVIVIFGAILGLQAADIGAVGALAAPLERSLHIDNTQIGLLVAVTTLIGCIATLPFGTVADRYNRSRVLQIVLVLWTVAVIAGSLSVSYGVLLITRLALGGVIAAAGPVLASLFGDLAPGDERSRLWSYVLVGELFGAGVGILVAGLLSGPFGWRIAMGVLSLPGVLLALAVRRWLPEPARGGQAHLHVGDEQIVTDPGADGPINREQRSERLGEASDVERQAEAAGAQPDPALVLTDDLDLNLWQATCYVVRIRTNIALILASGIGYFFLAGLETFAELYFRERYGVGQGLATLLFLLIGAGAVAGVIVGGRVTDGLITRGRTNARILIGAAAYAATAVSFAVGSLAAALAMAAPVFFLAAFCVGSSNPPVDAARLDIVPSRLWGRAEAVRTALRQGLQGAAPLIFGLVSQIFGGAGPGASSGVDTSAITGTSGAAHGLELAFVVLSAPLLVGAGALWLCRSAYLREVVAARRSDENTAEVLAARGS